MLPICRLNCMIEGLEIILNTSTSEQLNDLPICFVRVRNAVYGKK